MKRGEEDGGKYGKILIGKKVEREKRVGVGERVKKERV